MIRSPFIAMVLLSISVPAMAAQPLRVHSDDFADHGVLPPAFMGNDAPSFCQGQNLSPALDWEKPSAAHARSVAVIVYDSTPYQYRWAIVNIPPSVTQLPRDISHAAQVPGVQLPNELHHTYYDGPCPHTEMAHHLHFDIYVLDTLLVPGSIADYAREMNGHILQEGEIEAISGKP